MREDEKIKECENKGKQFLGQPTDKPFMLFIKFPGKIFMFPEN